MSLPATRVYSDLSSLPIHYSGRVRVIDAEDRKNRIKVEIKPYSPHEVPAFSDNVDYIRNSMKAVHLSPSLTVSSGAVYLHIWMTVSSSKRKLKANGN
jgi:hypothetical protein